MLISLGVLAVGAVEAADSATVFRQEFSGDLDSQWSRRVSEGAVSKFVDGWLGLEVGENTTCHIERPLAVDNATVTVRISGYGSVYVAWDEKNWCGVGKFSTLPFGRFYSTCTVDGETVEADHRGCNPGSRHYVRLQIGQDCIRFLYSNDGSTWIRLRAIERPKSFAGAPAIVAIGKHYGPGRKPFLAATAEPAASEPGARYAAQFADFRIEHTPKSALLMTSEERRLLKQSGEDAVGVALLRGSEDPTYAAVCRQFPAMKYAREIVGVPEHPLDIGVDWLGRIDNSPWAPPIAWIRAGEKLLPFVEAKQPLKRRLLDGYLPVITVSTNIGGVNYEQTVFGWSEGMSVDKDLYAFVRLRLRATKDANLPNSVTLCCKPDNSGVTWNLPTIQGRSAELCFKFKHPEPTTADLVNADEFRAKLEEVAEHWRKRIEPAERFCVPDERVNEAYRAWLVYSMLNADTVNGYVEPHDGAGFYEENFGYSVTLHTMALDMFGLHDYAERILEALLHFQQPDGLYLQACGLPDHGSFMMALSRHYEMTGDREWLQRVAPQLMKACEWVIQKREQAPKEGVTRGLIKFRPYNDYPEAVFNYEGNVIACQGMQEASDALRAAGMVQEADRVAREAWRYRQDILDSMDMAAFEQDGLTVLPIEPDTHRVLKLSRYRGGDYYGLLASIILETGFLDARDKRAYWITDMLEKRRGLVAGVCEFMEGIDHAYTYGYLMTQMRRDDIRKVILGFWSFLAFGMTRDTYSPVEVTMAPTGENEMTLPHLYSCTQQLRLLRDMLLNESGRTLHIGQAIPREWLRPGKGVSVDNAPTIFGPLTYSILPAADGTVRISLDPPLRNPADSIRVRIRHPDHAVIASVQASPCVPVAVEGEDIVLGRLTDRVDLRVSFR